MIKDEVKLPSTENTAFDTSDSPIATGPIAVRDAVCAPPDVTRLLGAHTGKLAIGVAATLGIMIYYNWRERRLAKQDPEGHARLQRLKAKVRSGGVEALPVADNPPHVLASSPG